MTNVVSDRFSQTIQNLAIGVGWGVSALCVGSALPVLVDEEHPEVVGEGGEHGLVRLEEDVPDGHGAVAQEAKLPLRVKLLQQDKTMVGQLHSSTCTKGAHTQTHAEE